MFNRADILNLCVSEKKFSFSEKLGMARISHHFKCQTYYSQESLHHIFQSKIFEFKTKLDMGLVSSTRTRKSTREK